MSNFLSYLGSIAVGLSLMACTTTPELDHLDQAKLEKIVDMKYRSDKSKARDQYRNPVETIKFFGIKPEMTVVEIWPGGGYYAEILAPYLLGEGKYIAASFNSESEVGYYREASKRFKGMVASRSEVFGDSIAIYDFEPPVKTEVAPAGTVDAVLTFRNVHNWMSRDGLDDAFAGFHKALKKGGILGVVEHRASTAEPQDPKAKNGYVREDFVIEAAKKAGFELVAKSEINANPSDTKNHPKGVWTLPPVLALKDKDRDQYVKVGESDRMTLKFRKI